MSKATATAAAATLAAAAATLTQAEQVLQQVCTTPASSCCCRCFCRDSYCGPCTAHSTEKWHPDTCEVCVCDGGVPTAQARMPLPLISL